MSKRGEVAFLLGLLFASASRVAQADGRDYHEEVDVTTPPAWLTIPVQVGHAAAWVPEQSGPIYKMGVSVLPGVRIHDRVQLHGVFEGLYRNPGWDAGLGARAAFLMRRLEGGFVPVHLMVEATYLVHGQGWRVLAGPMIGLGTLASVNILLGREFDRHEYVANIALAVDILAIWDPAAAIMHYAHHGDALHGTP